MIVFYVSMNEGWPGEGESVIHLMPMSMFRRLDPLPETLVLELVRYLKPPSRKSLYMQGRFGQGMRLLFIVVTRRYNSNGFCIGGRHSEEEV